MKPKLAGTRFAGKEKRWVLTAWGKEPHPPGKGVAGAGPFGDAPTTISRQEFAAPDSSIQPDSLSAQDIMTPIDPDIQMRGTAEAPREVRVAGKTLGCLIRNVTAAPAGG